MRGQCYDGASDMSGATKGVAARIAQSYPLALYLHCASHCLNLVVVSSLQDNTVRNMMGVVDRASVFLNAHPKRQTALEHAASATQPDTASRKVKDLCRTRWVQRLDALEAFLNLLPSLVVCFQEISEAPAAAWSRDSLIDAKGLLSRVTTTEFMSALVITNKCLGYVRGITSSLQSEARDIVHAMADVHTVQETLEKVRADVDKHHGDWFKVVESTCAKMNVNPSVPRSCGRQTHRDNVPADTPSEYYKRSISIPLLDHMVGEMKSRFTSHHRTALQAFCECVVPSILLSSSIAEANTAINKLVGTYSVDFPSAASVESELHCWHTKWSNVWNEHGEPAIPTSAALSLPHASQMFPNIRAILQLLCTLPVTSCSSERSFSALKRIKDRQRSTMGNERLTGLALLHIHHDIPVSIDAVIDEFARRHPKQMHLTNIVATAPQAAAPDSA
eukprot:scpid47775/ scgid13111/ 52 kDa repressor of the inhibitor of the protein kinase; 58 kDa interferon-induced protein kinase-interacting protein; Death-associated protein 4; THAP domain-containing protein 0